MCPNSEIHELIFQVNSLFMSLTKLDKKPKCAKYEEISNFSAFDEIIDDAQ